MKTLALVAHDGRKEDMVEFVRGHMEAIRRFHLVATATTGGLVKDEGLEVQSFMSGPLGGDAQIASLVATGDCHAVIFFRDPLGKHPHDPDISMLMRLCDVHDVPLATNPATARLVVTSAHLTEDN